MDDDDDHEWTRDGQVRLPEIPLFAERNAWGRVDEFRSVRTLLFIFGRFYGPFPAERAEKKAGHEIELTHNTPLI